jgi:hypothetical protein
MRYRLFVTDLDGTVLGPDLQLSERTREAFAKLHARGCTVAVATGRMVEAATPFARALGAHPAVITYNGAWIRDLDTGADLWHRAVPAALAAEAVAALEDAGLHVNLYFDDRVYLKAMTPEAEAYVAHARVTPVVVGAWDGVAHRAPTKILAIGPEAKVQATLAALAPRFAGRLWLSPSMPTFLEVADAAVNKGLALAHLAEHLGVPREAVVAVGDGPNDAEMLAWAGLGVAMADAGPAVRAQAGRVVPSVREDGVAALIDALIAEGRV